jgi:hypothetical protein
MIPRPNAVLVNVKDNTGKRWNVIYIRGEDGKYSHIGQAYEKTSDLVNLDPFVNWLDMIPGKEWVHPVIAKPDGKNGWYLKAFDTYNEARWNDESVSLSKLNEMGVIFKCFDKLLDEYKNMTEEELLEELNVGRLDPWTIEELEKL